MNLARARRLAPTIAAFVVISACGSGDDSETAPSDTEAITTVAPTTAAPTTAAPTTVAPTTVAPTTVGPTTTVAAATTTTITAATDEWETLGPGPFEVGVSTITVDDPDGDRPLTVDVWYPLADDADTAGLSAQRYTLLPGVFYESPDAFAATPDLIAPGRAPLVVYSHGSGGLRYIHSSYTEALASHGYVVAAPDHTGNTAIDRLTGSEGDRGDIAFDRPADVGRVIDAFTDPTHPAAGPWSAQAVDADLIAVTGHSFGGFTAVAMVTGFSNELGDITPDPRIDAIIPLAPATGEQLLPDDVISTIDVPMMIIAGTNDRTTPIDPNVTRLWGLNDNSPAYRVDIVDGAHQTFTDLCAYARFLPTLDAVPEAVTDTIESFGAEGCSPGDIDDQRAADITNTYAVQFLDEVLLDGEPVPAAAPADVVLDAR